MRLKRRNKRNERERQEREPETKEELKDKGMYIYFEDEEEMEGYIKYHNIKNFEYAGHQPRTIIFPASELIKEK